MKTYRSFMPIVSALGFFALTGCAASNTYTLNMRPHLAPNDTSSVSPKLKDKKYSRIMIMPPSGTARGEFDNQISVFEKEFIKNGITPINGAVTGRVVMELQGDQKEKKDESAQNLSDVERALIMAKQTGAEALLQIGQLDWSKQPFLTRYFIIDPNSQGGFKEVSLEEYTGSQVALKKAFRSPLLTFIGRLTDVQTGEVMASFEVKDASNWNLPAEYTATFNSYGRTISQNFDYETSTVNPNTGEWNTSLGEWVAPSTERATQEVIAEVAKSILAQQSGATTGQDTPGPTASDATVSSSSSEGAVSAAKPALGGGWGRMNSVIQAK